MEEMMIRTVNLSKYYGRVNALKNVRPNQGEIYVKGMKPGVKTRGLVSYSPEENHLYPWMKVKEAVHFFRGLPVPVPSSYRGGGIINSS